jgi:Outer membrane protein beta-barrel domain
VSIRIVSAFVVAFGCAALPAVAAPPGPWSGPYVGIGPTSTTVSASTEPYNYLVQQISGLTVTGRGMIVVPGTYSPAVSSAQATLTGGTLRAGYGWQRRAFVWGLEGQYGGAGGSGSSTTTVLHGATGLESGKSVISTRTVALGAAYSVRARAGVAFRDTAVYVTGGPAWSSVAITGTDALRAEPQFTANVNSPCPGDFCTGNLHADPASFRTSQRSLHHGTTFGAGVAHRVGRWTMLGLEWTHTSLGTRDYPLYDRLVETCSDVRPGIVSCAGYTPPFGPSTASPHAFSVTTSSLELKLDLRLR